MPSVWAVNSINLSWNSDYVGPFITPMFQLDKTFGTLRHFI